MFFCILEHETSECEWSGGVEGGLQEGGNLDIPPGYIYIILVKGDRE